MTQRVQGTASLALAPGCLSRKLSKMAWLRGAVLNAGEALLGVDMASVYPTLAWLRWVANAVLADLAASVVNAIGLIEEAAGGVASRRPVRRGQGLFDQSTPLAAAAYARRRRWTVA